MRKIISLIMATLLTVSMGLASACTSSGDSSSSEQSSPNLQENSSSIPEEDSSSKPICDSHNFGEWETVKEASCVAGEKQRVCENCAFTETEELPALDDFFAHTFDENTLCTTCGHQEFIQSEEYFEETTREDFYFGTVTCKVWWNTDRTFALKCYPGQGCFFIYGYMGNPVNVVLPIYDNLPSCYIDTNAFQNCTTLKSVYIPDTVTRIEAYAFDGCTALEKVVFADIVPYMPAVFSNCVSLSDITFLKTSRALHPFSHDLFQNTAYWNNYDGDIVYLDNMCLGSKTDNITSIKIKEGTKLIIPNAFYGTSIKEVTIPGSVIYWNNSFYNARLLEKVVIQEGVTSIDENAFSRCISLKELTLPASLQSIGDGAFSWSYDDPDMVIKRVNLSRSAAPEIVERVKQFPAAEIVYYD